MVDCPECGEPLKKGSNGQSKYYCDNERCIVAFVRHPFEPDKARIAYTGLACFRTAGLDQRKEGHQSIKRRLWSR